MDDSMDIAMSSPSAESPTNIPPSEVIPQATSPGNMGENMEESPSNSPPPHEIPRAISPGIKSVLDAAISNRIDSPDQQVVCGSNDWHVHKYLMYAKSPWFEEARDRYREASKSGNFSPRGIIGLDEEDDPDIVTRMFVWCYEGEYHSQPGIAMAEQRSHGQRAIIDAKVYVLAEKYRVENLVYVASRRFSQNLARALEGIAKDDQQASEIYHVIAAIKLAYASIYVRIHKSVLDALQHYHPLLLGLEPFKELIEEGGTFSYQILQSWVESTNKREFICSKCAYKPKYDRAESRQDMWCSCCEKKFGMFRRFPGV